MIEIDLNQTHQQLLDLVQNGRKTGESSSNGFARCGLRVPEVRALLKQPLIQDLQESKHALKLWHHVYLNTTSYELGSLAIYAFQYRELDRSEFNKLKLWTSRVDCWEHSDDLSKIYADTLEANPDWVLPVLTKWNQSTNPWQRRQSVVSLLEYTQKRQRVLPFEQLIKFIEPLLKDPEYYVQKGVGWSLREIYNAHPDKMIAFIKARYADIQPTAWSAATEKIDKKLKKELNLQRKNARSNS